jgi:hypothetical protein
MNPPLLPVGLGRNLILIPQQATTDDDAKTGRRSNAGINLLRDYGELVLAVCVR